MSKMEREISLYAGIFPESFKIFICGRNETKLLKLKFSKHMELVDHYMKHFGICRYVVKSIGFPIEINPVKMKTIFEGTKCYANGVRHTMTYLGKIN